MLDSFGWCVVAFLAYAVLFGIIWSLAKAFERIAHRHHRPYR